MKEPGRALDALVAERVMGWVGGGKYWIDPSNPAEMYGAGFTIGNTDYDIPPFKPSTDIAAAWLVVERLSEQGRVLLVKADGNRKYSGALRYTVTINGIDGRFDSNSAPHAICLAALKALGIEVE